MKKTVLPKEYQTIAYSCRHMRVDLLDRMKEMRAKLNDTVEGITNRALATGIPLLEAEHSGKRQHQRGKKDPENTARDLEALKKEKKKEVGDAVTTFDWTLGPGIYARLEIVGKPSEEDREFLKLCLDRAMRKLSESKSKRTPKE